MDETPTFACGMCGRCFADAEQIRLHIQTHTGQQPFRCVVCWPLFYDMSDSESMQPCAPSKPVVSAAVTPVISKRAPMSSKGAPVSQVEDTGKGIASDKVSSAASDKAYEPSDTPSPQRSLLTSQNYAATRKTDTEEGSAVGLQTSVTKGKRQSIADKSQSESLAEALNSTLSTNDDGPPVLEPEIGFVISNSSSKGLKSQENTMLDLSESVVGKVQSGFEMAFTDQNILMSAVPKHVLVDNGQKENPAEFLEGDSGYAEIDPTQNVDIPSNRVTEVKRDVCAQNDPSIAVPCDKSVTKRQNRDTFIQQKVKTDAQCNSQTDELLKDGDKTDESTRSAAGIETSRTNPSKESSQNSCMLFKTTTDVCDSDFINETDLRSENFDIDKDQNLTVKGSCTKLPSINVSGTDNLNCIQYTFEDLVSSADFQESQLVGKASSDSDSQDSFCQEISQGSDHSDKLESLSAEQSTSSHGRRKKGKPKKLSVESVQTPVVGRNLSQEADSDGHDADTDQQHADEMDCTEMQNSTQQVTCSPAYSVGNENLGKTKAAHHNSSSDLDHNVKDSAKKLEMVAQPSTPYEHQGKITPEGRPQDVAQGVAKKVSSEKPVRQHNMSDTAVSFRGVISFLKNFPMKALPDSKNTDRKVNTSIDQPESDEGPLLKTADIASSSPDLTHSLRCGEKEESSVEVGNENLEIGHLAEGNTADKMRDTTNKHFGEAQRELPCINNSSKSSTCKDSCNSLSEKSQVQLELQTQTLPTETAATGDSVSKDIALAPFSGVHSGSQSVPGTSGLTTADQQMTDLSGTVVGAKDTLSCAPVLASTGGEDAESDRVHISAEVRATKHSNNPKIAMVSSSKRKNPMFPEAEYNLSVCLPKLSESTLQSLLAGKTVNVNKVDSGKSPYLKFSRDSARCNDLKMSPAQLVQMDCSWDMHQGPHGQDIHDSSRQYHSNEVCPSEIGNYISANCKLATQETSEQTEQQKPCQKNTGQDSYLESAYELNPRIPDPEQRIEIQEREQEQSQTSHQNVTYSKDLVVHVEDSSPNRCAKEVENHVNKLCRNKDAQSNTTNGIQREEPGKELNDQNTCVMEGQTSVSAGALECSSQVVLSSQNNVTESTRSWPVMTKKHLQQRTKTGQMRKPLTSADGQIMSLTQTDSDHGEHVSPQQKESSVNQDSNDCGETVHPVSSDMKKKDCPVEISISREEHSDRQSMLDVTASQAMVVPTPGKQAKKAAETMSSVNLSDASDRSSAVFRRLSDESMEIIDLPKIIQPRRARLKQKSNGYYWKSSRAKTCAIVIKGRQNGHLDNSVDVSTWDKKVLPLKTDCYVDLGSTLKETQFQSLLTQPDSSQSSSLIMTTAICDHVHVEKEQTSASSERTPQMDLALEKNTSDDVSLEMDSDMSETSNPSLTYETFTPSVAELVKCAATRRKATIQSDSHPPSKKDKISEEISKETGMSPETHGASDTQMQDGASDIQMQDGASDIQMQEIKGGFSNKQNPQIAADEDEKVSHDEESLSFQEKEATHSPTKKLITYLNQPAYATNDGIKIGQTLRHSCSECGAVFRKHIKYLFHVANGCKRRFVCEVCGASLGRKETLKAHMTIHTGEAAITCQICGNILSGRQSFKNHMRIHTGEKPYKCPECSKSFRQSSALTSHIRTHSKESPFKCDICDKTFSCHKSLHSHRLTHTVERPFACHICDAAFHLQNSLNVHLRAHSHSDERPFACSFCIVRFAEKSERDQHMRQDHSHTIREMEYRRAKEEAKPHSCTMCNRGFSSLSSMRRHMRSFCLLLEEKVQNSE